MKLKPYFKLKPNFIDNFYKKIGLVRGDYKKVTLAYYKIFEKDIKIGNEDQISPEQMTSYSRKTQRFREKSPLHFTNKTDVRKKKQARCLIYAGLLVALNHAGSNLYNILDKIPYEFWKKNDFDIFPTKIDFIKYSKEYGIKEESKSFFDLISFFREKKLKGIRDDQRQLLLAYCENSFFDYNCYDIYQKSKDLKMFFRNTDTGKYDIINVDNCGLNNKEHIELNYYVLEKTMENLINWVSSEHFRRQVYKETLNILKKQNEKLKTKVLSIL